jgi:hypothetical protein
LWQVRSAWLWCGVVQVAACFLRFSSSVYFCNLKMESIYSTEIFGYLRTYNAEDSTLQAIYNLHYFTQDQVGDLKWRVLKYNVQIHLTEIRCEFVDCIDLAEDRISDAVVKIFDLLEWLSVTERRACTF